MFATERAGVESDTVLVFDDDHIRSEEHHNHDPQQHLDGEE